MVADRDGARKPAALYKDLRGPKEFVVDYG